LQPALGQTTLTVVENRVTTTASNETSPTLGNDGTRDLVVYTKWDVLNNGFPGPGDIWYQPLLNGQADGAPVQVTSDLTDDRLNDVSGNYIVYTAYADVASPTGFIMLYNIATGQLRALGDAGYVRDPKIYGNYVVWLQGVETASEVILYDINTNVSTSLAGPMPPSTEVQIGSRFVVWSSRGGSDGADDYDIEVFDFDSGTRYALTNTPTLDETSPTTNGDWVAWQVSTGHGSAPIRIEAYNGHTGEYRTIVEDGATNRLPSVDGGLIAWEGNGSGNFDVYVHRFDTSETFQVTYEPGDQYLNDLYGGLMAYVDTRNMTDEDIYVSTLQWSDTCTGPTAGLVGCYPFNGNTYDRSGNYLNGVLHGSPIFTTDARGNASGALFLDGTDDYVSLSNDSRFNLSQLTLSAIVKIPDFQHENWIISKGPFFGNYSLRINDGTHAYWPGYGAYGHQSVSGNWGSLASNARVPTNVFFDLTVTLSGTEFKAYVNGNLAQTASILETPLFNSDPVAIGAGGYDGLTQFFSGAIDELRIYNRPLAATEVCELYNSGVNTAPSANAGTDQTVHAGSSVSLNGSGSVDPQDNYPLSYTWNIVSAPSGSGAALTDGSAVNPSLTTDVTGDYTLQLVTTDSCGLQSEPDTVLISTTNAPPVADAGPDQSVTELGTLVTLDGSQSYDDDGDTVTYAWTLTSKPSGSGAVLSDPFNATLSFTADVQGEYVIELVVNDGLATSDPDFVIVSFNNLKPVADAGGNQAVTVGDVVQLNGSGTDANLDPLSYSWNFVSTPAGSEPGDTKRCEYTEPKLHSGYSGHLCD